MIALFLAFGLLFQAAPVQQTNSGTVTGTLKDAEGKPAAGIRVAARTRPESPADEKGNALLVSLAETDAEGRYRLERIPPGSYIISGGWLALPTYYPGSINLIDARQLTIAPGSTVSEIDFTLHYVSYSALRIPIKVTIQGGSSTLPVSPNGKFAQLRLMDEQNGRIVLETSLDAPSIAMPFSNVGLYLPIVENLPLGYSVQSITYGSRDARLSGIRTSAADFLERANLAPTAQAASELTITLVSALPAER